MAELPQDRGSDSSVDEIVEKKQRRDRVEGLVDALPEKYRVPVSLHYFHGFTHEEIAAALGLTRATVSNRIYRALKKLEPAFRRARLGEYPI